VSFPFSELDRRGGMWASAPAELSGEGGDTPEDGSGQRGEDREAGEARERGEELREGLPGGLLPGVELSFALEGMVSLAVLARRRSLAVFFHHGDLGRAGRWAEHEDELAVLGCMPVSVSAQSPEAQLRFAMRDLFGYMLLSDPDLVVARWLGLPTLLVAGEHAYEPLTLLVVDERIVDVLYPVDPVQEVPWTLERLQRKVR
jgi:peroxiredoxin